MHCLLASDDMGGKILFNQDFAVWLKPEPGKAFEALCILLEVFQTWHDGTQGSGIPQAKWEMQNCHVNPPTDARYFPVLFYPCLHPYLRFRHQGKQQQISRQHSGVRLHWKQRYCGVWTVTKWQSCKANEGVGDLFHAMFPDSEIGHTFACSSYKTVYISKFGLVPCISDQLVADANNDTFVLMLKSLNQTTKTKHLHLHVSYSCKDHVQFRYLVIVKLALIFVPSGIQTF